MGREIARRRVLAAAGSGGLALTLPTTGATSSNGAVVFVYDDGPIEDYTRAFPVHREFDAPASVGVVPEWIGREGFMGRDWMTLEHLRELEDAGWEILSHTTEHTALGTYDLTADVAPGDDRLYVERNRHGYYAGKDLEVTDGDRTVRCTVAGHGADDRGQYVELEGSIDVAFRAEGTVERYPADLMESFLRDSRRELESHGFDVDGLLCPYDRCDGWTREFLDDHYDAVANANHGSAFNDAGDYDPLETNRDYFVEYTTPAAVRADLEEVADRDGLAVLGAHTFKPEVTGARIRETLELTAELDLEVVTLREAAERFGGRPSARRRTAENGSRRDDRRDAAPGGRSDPDGRSVPDGGEPTSPRRNPTGLRHWYHGAATSVGRAARFYTGLLGR